MEMEMTDDGRIEDDRMMAGMEMTNDMERG